MTEDPNRQAYPPVGPENTLVLALPRYDLSNPYLMEQIDTVIRGYNPALFEHSERVRVLAGNAFYRFPLPATPTERDKFELNLAAKLHDIGKVQLEDYFGTSGIQFTQEMLADYRLQHTTQGSDWLLRNGYPPVVVFAARLHHFLNDPAFVEDLQQRFNPYMLLALTLIAMADIYDALMGNGENGRRKYQVDSQGNQISFTMADVFTEWQKKIHPSLLTRDVINAFLNAPPELE